MVRHTGEDFIDEKRITETTVFSFQAAGIDGSELDAPEPNSFTTDCDASLSKQIFDIAMAEVESVVEPNSIRNYVGWESVAFICGHLPILAICSS